MLGQLEERNPQPTGPVRSRQPPELKPYQLKPKRGRETFIEPPVKQKEVPPPNAKQIKRMKKKLGKPDKKIRHSMKKHNNLISKRNSIKKKIEELKGPRKPKESHKPKESFSPVELEQTFNRAYRSYRINGRSRVDVDTLFDQIRQNLIDLISRKLADLGSARVQTTVWIRFRIEYEDGIIDRVRLPFNSQMADIFQGNDLNEIVNEMFAHMKAQIENPALANSRFIFDEVVFLDINFHQLN